MNSGKKRTGNSKIRISDRRFDGQASAKGKGVIQECVRPRSEHSGHTWHGLYNIIERAKVY